MNEESATGRGLPNPVYPDLVERLVNPSALPDDDIRFVMAVASSYAYGDVRTVATIMDRLGLTRVRCRMVSEWVDALFLTSVAYLAQSGDGRVAILCYRGTPPTSVITWLTDFEIEPVTIEVPTLSGEVHGGFYRNVRSTRFRIVELLQDAIADGLQALYVTGHSLGGASAALLPALLVGDPIKYGSIDRTTPDKILDRLEAVYTYGSPMIGNRAFAKACEHHPRLAGKVVRYVYANDVVPQLPPAASGPFKHFGREYRYKPSRHDGRWRESKRPRRQLRHLFELATAPLAIPAKALRVTRRIPFHASLSDHFPQYYLDALTPSQLRSEFGK